MFKNLKRYRRLSIIIIIVFFIVFLLSRGYIYPTNKLVYGITFSHEHAESLGLPWQEVFQAILNDLGVKKLRLSAYWDVIEPGDGDYNWDYLDWQIARAEEKQANIILAIGGRLPRWPECHYPEWALDEPGEERQADLLAFMEKTVERYRNNKSIVAWQVENEPFLRFFGECPGFEVDFLDKEIALVKSLDRRPIMLTDSGELSAWIPAAKRADIFGTTMYRDTYSEKLKQYVHYPIEPGFFRFKHNLVHFFARPQKWVVIELQAEPWGPMPYQLLTAQERALTMNLEKFREIISFSAKTGFQEFYLWGAEWWYWEKTVNQNEGMWLEAKKLFAK